MKRNDPVTVTEVMAYIDKNHAATFGEVHRVACVQAALDANSADVGCRIADNIAATLRRVRERFTAELNLRATL